MLLCFIMSTAISSIIPPSPFHSKLKHIFPKIFYNHKHLSPTTINPTDFTSQLAKFSGPTAGFRRQFDRSAGGSRRRTDSGSAKRRDSGLLAANGRLLAAALKKAAFTLARPLGAGGSLGFAHNRFWVPPNALAHRLVPSLLTNVSGEN